MLSLYGSYDCHIKMLEETFQIKIRARGEEIVLEGIRERVRMAAQVLSDLIHLLDEGRPVSLEDVRFAIQTVYRDKDGHESEVKSKVASEVSSKSKAPEVPHQKTNSSVIYLSGKNQAIKPKTSAQKDYIENIRQFDISVGIGPAGTGKTYLAMAMAVSAFQNREVERIILARPAVEAGERLGFLPGDLTEKINPYLRPLYDALYDMMSVDHADRLLERGDIEIAPLAFMRGRTLNHSFIVLDEAQNATSEQMKMFLTRLGSQAKAVITGDVTQVDLPEDQVSGLIEIQKILNDISGIQFSYFTEKDIVRHPLVKKIVKAYEEHEQKEGRKDTKDR